MRTSNLQPIQRLQISFKQANLSQDKDHFGSKATVNMGRNWQKSELLLLLYFLEQNASKLKSQKQRKSSKVYKNMSLFIRSRNVNQCRSYSKKIIEKFRGVDQAVIFLQEILREELETNNCMRKQISPQKDTELQQKNVKSINKSENQECNSQSQKNILFSSEEKERLASLSIKVNRKKLSARLKDTIPRSKMQHQSHQLQEHKDKEQLIPTGIDYEPYNQYPHSRNTGNDFLSAAIYPINSRKSIFEDQKFVNTQIQPFLFQGQAQQRRKKGVIQAQTANESQRNRQWLQCHNLYLRWQFKLTQTMQTSPYGPLASLFLQPNT